MGFAIWFTLAPFTFFHSESVDFFVLRDYPYAAGLYFALAAVLWVCWIAVSRRLRVTGL